MGNGGYVCGTLAAFIDGPAEVSLRAPTPLGRPLTVASDADTFALNDGDTVIARAKSSRVELDLPPCPSFADSHAAPSRFEGLTRHGAPDCFVCGPNRGDDALRIFPGPVPGTSLVAATWTPSAAFVDARGPVAPIFLWAALDCPGYFAHRLGGAMALLGTLSARIVGNAAAGDALIVIGWPIGDKNGRKVHAGSAVFGRDGTPVAMAKATWILM